MYGDFMSARQVIFDAALAWADQQAVKADAMEATGG